MSPRRRRPPAVGSPARTRPSEPSQEELLRKYQELLARHEALVRKLELRNEEQLSTHRLATWALETSASALALIDGGVVLLANQRWHELSRHSGPWYRVHEGRQEGPALKTLRQVAITTSKALSETGEQGPLLAHYREHTGTQTLEVRTERVGGPRAAARRAVLVLVHDITSQVQTEKELEQARATIFEQEHLRALGELASGVAHDLSNTFNSMRLRLEMIQRDQEFAARHRSHLDALQRIISDAHIRLRNLQDFSRQQPEHPSELVQLADIIREAVDIARNDIEHRAAYEGLSLRIEVEVPPLPLVHGMAADLRYVFINLLLNARDAMPLGGTIRVRGTVADSRIVITVEDEGTGIPKPYLHSIFRPFFTTKGSRGTGLGLSMAYGVMSRAGGSIVAANRPEGGAVFTLTFPTPESRAQPPLDTSEASEAPPVLSAASAGRVQRRKRPLPPPRRVP